MNEKRFKSTNDVIYNVVSYSKDEITLERYDDKTNKKIIIEIENAEELGKDIIQILSNQYIKRISDITQANT